MKLMHIATLWTVAVVIVVVYGIYVGYISYYHGALIGMIFIPFYLILILMSNEFRRSLNKFENLSATFERYLKNEDFRRDLEVLPIFIEERRREYLRGLREGYEYASNVLDSLEKIKGEVERSNERIVERLERYEQAINLLIEQIRRLRARNSRGRKLFVMRKREKLKRLK